MENNEFSYELKIPKERIAVLIGENGKTKKEIEEATQSKLDITKDGEVTIIGSDGLLLYTTREIVRAVARGFNPKIALLLLKTDYALEIIEIKDVAGKNKATFQRIKGRVIGKEGKSRMEIERLTDTHISVFGKTVAIIGESAHALLARKALAMIIEGSMHNTVLCIDPSIIMAKAFLA